MCRKFPAAKLIVVVAGVVASVVAGVWFPLTAGGEDDVAAKWSEQAAFRLLVRIDAAAAAAGNGGNGGKGRSADQRPAELAIDFEKLIGRAGPVDVASLRVVRFDPKTGDPLPSPRFAADGASAAGAPFRWYDDSIPYEFPEFHGAVSRTKGRIERKPVTRGGHFFNVLGDWRRGRLTWQHQQQEDVSSYYAVYFDRLPAGKTPAQLPPRGWLGDGVARAAPLGETTLGADHCRIDWVDWDGDGLLDLIAGEHYGHLFWLPNVGDRGKPEFRFAKFIRNADGQPLDAGMAAAPKAVDWDNDGDTDLLVGTEWNRILYYRNDGDDRRRQLRYQGWLTLDGEVLQLPVTPMERGSEQVFKRDYYPVLETVDWDGDGDLDLLAGGYVTGRVYFYENAERTKDGSPKLRFRGPLQADDKPLNVGHWCASPCAVDLDADGDLDLLSGNMPMHVKPGEPKIDSLLLYTNAGDASGPRLQRAQLPAAGSFGGRLATPRAADWDGDGDFDLAVGSRENIYLFENIGTASAPKFQLHHDPLRFPWGLSSLAVRQFRDWNGDGRLDLIHNYSVTLNSGDGNPYRWEKRVAVLPPGETIAHPSRIGDDWFWPFLDDFDEDGRTDVLFGDWHGQIWLHRNQTRGDARRFDLAGARLLLDDGQPLKVGPIGKDPTKDFAALQGARTVFTAADFDRDGRRDLVVGDTYGKVRLFRNVGVSTKPKFSAGVEFGDLGIRLLVDATDWNADGWPDVVAGAANGRVQLFLNRGEAAGDDDSSRFAAGVPLKLPRILQPRVLMADINGDGDDDLFLPSTQGSCYVERSFLDGGYARAKLLRLERR